MRFIGLFLKYKPNFAAKRVFVLLNAAFAVGILDIISDVHMHHLLLGYRGSFKYCAFSIRV